MATFKIKVRKERQKNDGTYRVYIQVSHNRHTQYIPTDVYASPKDLTKTFEIKNQVMRLQLESLVNDYRRKVLELGACVSEYTCATIVKILTKRNSSGKYDFIEFAQSWCDTNPNKIKAIRDYYTVLRSFKKFMGRGQVFASEITTKLLNDYQRHISEHRNHSKYMILLCRMFKEMREFYNDEDNDIIIIRNTISSYKPPKPMLTKKRALDIDVIRKMMSLTENTGQKRRDLARDCFLLSFCLMGMNSTDLYHCTKYEGNTIVYNRMKTKDRRDDEAEMKVDVPPIIKHIFERYRGKERVFNFHKRYYNEYAFNKAINTGLKAVSGELGIDKVQFYSARHSVATIAVNDVGIDKYVVNEMLCHISEEMKVTDIYIKKDFSIINKANERLLQYVFREQYDNQKK